MLPFRLRSHDTRELRRTAVGLHRARSARDAACVLLAACATRDAARPIVVQGAMDVEIRKLAGAIQNATEEHVGGLDVLARHGRRLSGGDLQDPEGHGERRRGDRARRRTFSSDRRSSIRARPAVTSPDLHVYDIVLGTQSVNLGSFKTGYRARGPGSDVAEWSPLDLMRSDGSAGQDPNARTMRRFAADESLLAAARSVARTV